MKKILILSLLVSLSWAVNITQVKFSGLSQLSAETALEITTLKIGETITPKRVNEAILNLYEQNYFSDILVEQEGGVLHFKLKQKQSIARIEITGVASNDKKQIDSILNIKKGYLYDEGLVK